MAFRNLFFVLIVGILFSVQSCKEPALFEEMSPEDTGISFSNQITEDGHNNIMTYEYTYNGGGVAVGDLNNDGLPDVYFSGNSVPNKLFINKGDWKFQDVSEKSGVEGKKGWKTGVTMADVNGDGWLDIYVSYSGNAPEEGYNKPVIRDYQPRANQLFINNGGKEGAIPTFTESAKEYGIDAVGTFTTQAYFLDYDLDGDLDLFLLNHANMFYSAFHNVEKLRNMRHPYFGNKLLRNESHKFTEVSESTGIHGSGLNFGLSAAISDINKDGWPDIYVTNDYEEQDFLYINNKDGTFNEISHRAFGHLSKFGMGSDIADINNDALPDIVVLDMLPEDNYRQKILKGSDEYDKLTRAVESGYHHQYMKNTLQLNRGLAEDSLPSFSEIAQFAGISNTDWSWSALLADFDNDGFKDLFVTNGYLRDVTNMDFVNSEANKEISRAHSSKQPVDLMPLIKTMPSTKIPNYLFRNSGGYKFQNNTQEWGLDKKSVSNGAVYADLDNDGDLDLIVNNLNEPVTVYKNNQETILENNFIKISLKGQGSNSFGLGAKVITTLDNDEEFYHEAYYTRGYLSSVEPVLTIGVGKTPIVKKIIVAWPDGRVSEIQDVKVNQTIIIEQEGAVEIKQDFETGIPLLVDVTAESGLDFEHKENNYVDFLQERLLPYQLSRLGGVLAVGDVNQDGNDDVFFGGAAGQPGQLYFGTDDGKLIKSIERQPWHLDEDLNKEDLGILFFDADGDNDLDMYVVSGGNEHPEGASYYQDRLYINNGEGVFQKSKGLPNTSFSGGVAVAADFDNDGDLDVFIGGRIAAQNYPFTPKSVLLRNDTQDGIVRFTNLRDNQIERIGMVTDAAWTDLDNDSWLDLVLVGEWMPVTVLKNNKGKFENVTEHYGLENTSGWWSTIKADDFDGDGDVDFLLGNGGVNSQFQASIDEPMVFYVQDFNNDGDYDPILSYYIQGKSYPFVSRDDLLGQVNSLRKEYKTYDKYAKATMKDLFKAGNVTNSAILEIKNLESSYLENLGQGDFNLEPLPALTQFSMVNGFVHGDFLGDGSKNILVAGNFYPYRVNLGKSDASMGVLLNVENQKIIPDDKDYKLWLTGDIRGIEVMRFNNGEKRIVVSRNNDRAGLYRFTTTLE